MSADVPTFATHSADRSRTNLDALNEALGDLPADQRRDVVNHLLGACAGYVPESEFAWAVERAVKAATL